jgi:hypothetical protein
MNELDEIWYSNDENPILFIVAAYIGTCRKYKVNKLLDYVQSHGYDSHSVARKLLEPDTDHPLHKILNDTDRIISDEFIKHSCEYDYRAREAIVCIKNRLNAAESDCLRNYLDVLYARCNRFTNRNLQDILLHALNIKSDFDEIKFEKNDTV